MYKTFTKFMFTNVYTFSFRGFCNAKKKNYKYLDINVINFYLPKCSSQQDPMCNLGIC